jgi:drug/metabolite transporter (DMT)-like permease
VLSLKSNSALAAGLLLAVFLWGGNNTGTKFLVTSWPPIWTGGSRFLCAGLLMLVILRWTNWLGSPSALTNDLKRQLWWRGGLSLAAYIVVFNCALRYAPASHVVLYLGASPVWALFWERWPARSWHTARRYGAAALALAGVVVLLWPALRLAESRLSGELLGLAASVLWTNHGRQCRALGASLNSTEITAQAMWRAGALLMPFGLAEVGVAGGLVLNSKLILVQAYCIVAGGVAAFAIWNHALWRWPASRVFIFNNLIPLSTAGWACVCLGEQLAPAFWVALILIVTGVALGQTQEQKPETCV